MTVQGELPSREPDRSYAVEGEFFPKPLLRLPASLRSLAVVQREFVLFTPAAAYLYAGFPDAVLTDHARRHGDPGLAVILFDSPLFGGLETSEGDPTWNRALWLVRREAWPRFADSIVTASLVDSVQRRVYRLAWQRVRVLDPLAVSVVVENLPLVTVHAVGVRSNRRTWRFAPDGPFGTVPTLRRDPPDRQCLAFAEALFGKEDPAAALAADIPPPGTGP